MKYGRSFRGSKNCSGILPGAMRLLLILVPVLLIAGKEEIYITYSNGVLSVGNNLIERQFRYDRSASGHSFYPIAFIDKTPGRNLMTNENREWFELCINQKILMTRDGGWDYKGYSERSLENGGKEILIRLKKPGRYFSPLSGLELIYYLQIFPGSTVTREKLELVSNKDGKHRLTTDRGKIKLIFPVYSFNLGGASRYNIEEIRLAEWEGEVLPEVDWRIRPNDRLRLGGGKSGRNLSQNHMYHPGRFFYQLSGKDNILRVKGPIVIATNTSDSNGILIAYEHGSPDGDEEQDYLKIGLEMRDSKTISAHVEAVKGAYFNGESFHRKNPYSTVWVEIGTFRKGDFDVGEAVFRDFIYQFQSEHLASRKPTIYYNTWGMQRDEQMEKKIKPQKVLTEDRLLREIGYAHQLGVDVFVIDDGWQKYFGDWQPDRERLPDGFGRIKAKLDSLGMRLGIWMAAEGIDTNSTLYHEHPEWLVRDKDGNEVIGRWNKPIGCFSSGYKQYFAELCKRWIDRGVTYFKWDGLDKHLCYSPEHNHGSSSNSPEERALRSGYDFILAVTDVARELTEYNPDVVIVYDVTEKSRNVGLAFLSEARFFWINNGATWYDDLSYYRAKSIRTVANLYTRIIPTVLQTSANYPHQSEKFGAQHYNVNTTLLGGGGFWGDLSEMSADERKQVGELVRLYKRVAETVVATRPKITGTIGSSPEVYEFISPGKAGGQIIAFSGEALLTEYRTQPIIKNNFMAVLRNAYTLQENGTLLLPLLFPQPEATCEAFIISNNGFPVRIEQSTCWLKDIYIDKGKILVFTCGASGKQKIIWDHQLGKPQVSSSNDESFKLQINEYDGFYEIITEETAGDLEIRIASGD